MPNNEWGDFQTPLALSAAAVNSLRKDAWGRVLEPTCGTGSFLKATMQFGEDVERVGIEIQPEHVEAATTAGFKILPKSIFELDLASDVEWGTEGPLLVVGNPPWVTNAQLGVLSSINLPSKSNIRNLRGLDAMTGASNFDIAEFIYLKLMIELQAEKPTISMLVKTHVARNVLDYAARFNLPYTDYSIREIDAKRWFGASVDACLFTVEYSDSPEYVCNVYSSIEAEKPERTIGVVNERMVANVEEYAETSFADGKSPVEWRSGVKHDASAVMEISEERKVELGLEDEYVFPLLKCTDIFRGRLTPKRFMVIPQRRLGEDTTHLCWDAPVLWSYLQSKSAILDSRGSSIYRTQPRFAVFGLGDYTFAPYKIAISGLHKKVQFALLGSHESRPVVVDDASYTLGFEDGYHAAMCFSLLNSATVTSLLDSLVFWDAKRPVNKKLLQRVDLLAVAERSELAPLAERANKASCELSLEPLRLEQWQTVLGALMTGWRSATQAKPGSTKVA